METSLLLAEKIAQLTLIVLMGIALVKFKLLKPADSYPLSVITLYLISPAVMIHAFQVDYTPEILDGLWLSVKLALLFNFSLIMLGKLFAKIFKLDILEQAAVIYTNAGNLIIPVVLAVFGAEWLIYTAGYLIVQTVLFWTHLRVMFAGRSQMSVKKIFTNVNILSIAVGLFMFAFQIKLPSVVDNALANVGSMIGPIAMMIAGMLIASLPLKEIIASKRIYLVTFLRLILIPLVLLIIIKLFGLATKQPQPNRGTHQLFGHHQLIRRHGHANGGAVSKESAKSQRDLWHHYPTLRGEYAADDCALSVGDLKGLNMKRPPEQEIFRRPFGI